MKTYSDIGAIDSDINLVCQISVIGKPFYKIFVNEIEFHDKTLNLKLELLRPISFRVELQNKVYSQTDETAVIIEKLEIDHIKIVPHYTHLVKYLNDHNYIEPTNYIGFNGSWFLNIDKPFYHWLHEVKGNGWLLQ